MVAELADALTIHAWRDGKTPDQRFAVVAGLVVVGPWFLRNLASRQPASLEVVALLRKPDAVKVEVPVRYLGFDIPNEFVVGYGLDYAERYRGLRYVGRLKPEVYTR